MQLKKLRNNKKIAKKEARLDVGIKMKRVSEIFINLMIITRRCDI